MKNRNPFKSAFRLSYFFLFVLLAASCSKEEETIYGLPSISIQSGEFIEVRRGEQINVTLNLQAEGGNRELMVFQNGAVIDRVTLEPNASTYTYSNQSVPEDAAEGEEFMYEFALVNTNNNPSARAELTVSTIAYGTITIGGTELYEVELPEDEIIEAGSSYRFVSGRSYYISRSMRFQSGASLHIGEDVRLYMNPDASPAADIDLLDGASVEIVGTAEQPVIITSANTLTSSAGAGDWGWFNLRVSDGSGEVRYLRLEYGGNRNLRLQGVNAPTIIEHVQVYKADGEGIMITDGDVNLKYIVATDCSSGAFRIGDAYSGHIQFAIATTSLDDDNDEFSVRETASPTISNITVLGPGTETSNTHGIRLRAASSAKIYNSIVAEFPRRGLRLNDEVQVTDLNGPTVFAYSYIFNVPTDPFRDDTDNGNPFRGYIDAQGVLQNPFHNNVTGFEGSRPVLAIIPGIGVGDFVPDAEQASTFNPNSLGAAFTGAAYVGAVSNSSNDWTRGWVKNSDGSIR